LVFVEVMTQMHKRRAVLFYVAWMCCVATKAFLLYSCWSYTDKCQDIRSYCDVTQL